MTYFAETVSESETTSTCGGGGAVEEDDVARGGGGDVVDLSCAKMTFVEYEVVACLCARYALAVSAPTATVATRRNIAAMFGVFRKKKKKKKKKKKLKPTH
jgi:hypothetical protein